MLRAVWHGEVHPHPRPAAGKIAGHVEFWRGVQVERVPGPGQDMAGGTGSSVGRPDPQAAAPDRSAP